MDDKKKISVQQLWLTVAFVVAHIISNIMTVKQVSLPFGIISNAGTFVFPVTYILSDVFSEVYGYSYSRKTCYASFGANLFATAVFQIAIFAPYPEWYDMQDSFACIFGNTPRILIASMLAYVVGDLINDKIFARMKVKGNNKFGTRAIVSSVFGEIADAAIFTSIAFYGLMPAGEMVQMMFTEAALKILCECLILPITALVVRKVSRCENSMI